MREGLSMRSTLALRLVMNVSGCLYSIVYPTLLYAK